MKKFTTCIALSFILLMNQSFVVSMETEVDSTRFARPELGRPAPCNDVSEFLSELVKSGADADFINVTLDSYYLHKTCTLSRPITASQIVRFANPSNEQFFAHAKAGFAILNDRFPESPQIPCMRISVRIIQEAVEGTK